MGVCSVDPTHPVIGQAGGSDRWCPKHLREVLCKQEMYAPDKFTSDLIGRLVLDLDRHRPLGTNGKHGDLHTDTCGCEDK
jgi:hypothetical protein